MGFFGMLFWIVVLWLVIRALRRSDRCVAVGPTGYWPGWYRGHRSEMRDTSRNVRTDRDDYIDALETRISQLEERLDFTERLLSSRSEK